MTTLPSVQYVNADGVDVFYRQAGSSALDAPTVLLLHGFPSSSHMFRNLLTAEPLQKYRLIAPDFPGFGFTNVTNDTPYEYTFESLTNTLIAFVDALKLDKFVIYIFDYGAPIGLRMALQRPSSILGIVTQNGNAYVEGLENPFWDPIVAYQKSGSVTDREALFGFLTLEATKMQYTDGSPNPDKIQPEAYFLDQALLDREGNKEIQLDLFYDYRTNVLLYKDFQEYFRTSKVPVLAVWGKNDNIFIAPGAEAYRRDVENFELHFLDTGHFALETNELTMANYMAAFFEKNNIFG